MQSCFWGNHTQLTSAVLALKIKCNIKPIIIVESVVFTAGLHQSPEQFRKQFGPRRFALCYPQFSGSLVPVHFFQSIHLSVVWAHQTFFTFSGLLLPTAVPHCRSQVNQSTQSQPDHSHVWRSGAPGHFPFFFSGPFTLTPAHGCKGYLTFRKWRDREGVDGGEQIEGREGIRGEESNLIPFCLSDWQQRKTCCE